MPRPAKDRWGEVKKVPIGDGLAVVWPVTVLKPNDPVPKKLSPLESLSRMMLTGGFDINIGMGFLHRILKHVSNPDQLAALLDRCEKREQKLGTAAAPPEADTTVAELDALFT